MSNRPVHEIRLGHVKAVIWANQTDKGVRHNVTVARLFFSREGEKWETSDAFGRDDLPLLAKVADLAHTWIFIETQNGLGGSETDSEGQPTGRDKAGSPNKAGSQAGSRR
jgi:hypothetical protein